MQRRLRRFLNCLRERTTVGYAKIATIGGFCDLDLIVVKATSPNDLPLSDRYVHELLLIFSISPSSYQVFSISFARRFGKTQCWRVALKCLVLLHRLLRTLPDNNAFRNELQRTRSKGLLSLYPCHFHDCSSSSASEDYTVFIRSYARLLDEALNCCSSMGMDIVLMEEEPPEILADKMMQELHRIHELLPQIQRLIDRAMDCRPKGPAAGSCIVRSAMKYIIQESSISYTTYRREIVVVLDNLIQLPYRSSIQAFGIYKRAAIQANQLCEFYDWCKSLWLCSLYEYPFVDRIPEIQIQALEAFLNGMWQLTESSSPPPSPSTSTMQSQLSLPEDDRHKQLVSVENLASHKNGIAIKFKKDEEMAPLIQFDDVDENVSWEALLESSITIPCIESKSFFPPCKCWPINCPLGMMSQSVLELNRTRKTSNPVSYNDS